MKRSITLLNLFLLALVANFQIAVAQDATSLSNEGLRYWKAAEALLSMSSEKEYVIRATKELEKVTISDPYYAETYYKLATLYSQLGKENGNEFFNLAEANYIQYKRLKPEEAGKIDDEIYILSVIRESSFNQWPIEEQAKYIFSPFEGVWEGDGLKVRISNLQNIGVIGNSLGNFTISNYSGSSVNNKLWDSYTDGVQKGVCNVFSDGTLHWWGMITYNSRAKNNRTFITEYKNLGTYSWDYDTNLEKSYTASIVDGHLEIQCKTLNRIIDDSGSVDHYPIRSSKTDTYILYRSR